MSLLSAVSHWTQMHWTSDQHWSFSTDHAYKPASQLIRGLQGRGQEVMCWRRDHDGAIPYTVTVTPLL